MKLWNCPINFPFSLMYVSVHMLKPKIYYKKFCRTEHPARMTYRRFSMSENILLFIVLSTSDVIITDCWNCFFSQPEEQSLDFSHGTLLDDDTSTQYRACGVCLLDVDMKVRGVDLDTDNAKLTYGGRQYHAPCANFWINCVDSTLPALKLPELLWKWWKKWNF